MYSGVQKKKFSSRGFLTDLILPTLIGVLACAQANALTPAGGAIGNAKYVPYESKLMKLSTVYPDTWDHLDVGTGVTFLEPSTEIAGANPASSVHIDQQGLVQIQTISDLEQYLKFFQPGFDWSATSQGGAHGFKASENGQGAQYFLRKAGDVISVTYKESDSLSAQERIAKIIGSLELK